MLITLDVRSGATVDIVFVTTVVTDCSFGGGSAGGSAGGGSVGGGRAIEVCYYQTWRVVASSHWTQEDSQVVCRQLGFTSEGNM